MKDDIHDRNNNINKNNNNKSDSNNNNNNITGSEWPGRSTKAH